MKTNKSELKIAFSRIPRKSKKTNPSYTIPDPNPITAKNAGPYGIPTQPIPEDKTEDGNLNQRIDSLFNNTSELKTEFYSELNKKVDRSVFNKFIYGCLFVVVITILGSYFGLIRGYDKDLDKVSNKIDRTNEEIKDINKSILDVKGEIIDIKERTENLNLIEYKLMMLEKSIEKPSAKK
ncbi:hypothetical protein K4L44_05885 [Halosquirtibacter laminarini]|uniref:Uncharacterized protein n=1 Tax=Halosquirtibacter laminarini TaxID=3374600 RepID=A0AC61NNZ9_9BACT|nr:hypothetical protein K4L44_05885 [Prolixibacteraceae bacterium]